MRKCASLTAGPPTSEVGPRAGESSARGTLTSCRESDLRDWTLLWIIKSLQKETFLLHGDWRNNTFWNVVPCYQNSRTGKSRLWRLKIKWTGTQINVATVNKVESLISRLAQCTTGSKFPFKYCGDLIIHGIKLLKHSVIYWLVPSCIAKMLNLDQALPLRRCEVWYLKRSQRTSSTRK